MQLLQKRERTGMEGKGESEKSGRVWSFDARGLGGRRGVYAVQKLYANHQHWGSLACFWSP